MLQDEEAEQLVTAMLEANALELLVQRMGSFNDRTQDDDASAVFSALNIIENLVEVSEKVSPGGCPRPASRWSTSPQQGRALTGLAEPVVTTVHSIYWLLIRRVQAKAACR